MIRRIQLQIQWALKMFRDFLGKKRNNKKVNKKVCKAGVWARCMIFPYNVHYANSIRERVYDFSLHKKSQHIHTWYYTVLQETISHAIPWIIFISVTVKQSFQLSMINAKVSTNFLWMIVPLCCWIRIKILFIALQKTASLETCCEIQTDTE